MIQCFQLRKNENLKTVENICMRFGGFIHDQRHAQSQRNRMDSLLNTVTYLRILKSQSILMAHSLVILIHSRNYFLLNTNIYEINENIVIYFTTSVVVLHEYRS